MNQFKRAKVILLPTNKEPIKGDLLLRHIWKGDLKLESNTLWQYKDTIVIDKLKQYTTLNGSFRDWYRAFIPVNIYVTSDDEIKEGDWFIDKNCSLPISAGFNKPFSENENKIICTADTSLSNQCIRKDGTPTDNYSNVLPQPSQQFIEKYIESYNKGNIITDILVEYENISGNCKRDYCQHWGIISCSGLNGQDLKSDILNPKKLSLNEISGTCGKEKINQIVKINPKDNTITIKKLKDSWNREEVKQLLIDCCGEVSCEDGKLLGKGPAELIRWIEKTL